jgi:hypothetical protein
MRKNVLIKKNNWSFKTKNKPEIKAWQKLLFLSPIFIIVLLFKGNDWYKNYQLSKNGVETWATITMVSNIGVRDPVEIENIAFEFKVNYSIITGYSIAETNNNYAFAKNGLPLSIGDKYSLKYVKNHPDNYQLNLSKADSTTINHYIQLASAILEKIDFFPETEFKQQNCTCLANEVYQKFGLDGLSSILFYNESVAENISNNSITFKNLMKKKEVQEIIRNCSK